MSPDLKEGAATQGCRPEEKQLEGHEPVTEQRCSSLLSQGHLPGLTHMGIVETPRHEPPLCPVPPGAGGVTTIAPGERDSSSSTLNLFKSVPAFPRISRPRDTKASGQEGAKKELRAPMPPNPKAVMPPYQVPGQPLLPGAAEATHLGDPTPHPALDNCKSHRQKACA